MLRNASMAVVLLGVVALVARAQVAQKPVGVVKGFRAAQPLVILDAAYDDESSRAGWIRVDWDPKAPESKRAASGEFQDAGFSPTNLQLRLSWISPRASADETKREQFARMYVDGVAEIVQTGTPFSFAVSKEAHPGPWQYSGGILRMQGPFDSAISVQLEIVGKGFAVVSERDRSTMSDISYDYYRDELLRAEGAACALKRGVWAGD